MSEILSIEKLRELSTTVVEIPGFDNKTKIKVRLKKPSLMSMIAEGKVPNHLLGAATAMVGGQPTQKKGKTDEDKTRDIIGMLELYCQVCLVEPSYEEFKDIMTDQQKEFIFDWGISDVIQTSTFRDQEEVQSSDNDGETL